MSSRKKAATKIGAGNNAKRQSNNKKEQKTTVEYLPSGKEALIFTTTETTTTTTTTTKRVCINNKNKNFHLNEIESILDKDSSKLSNNKALGKNQTQNSFKSKPKTSVSLELKKRKPSHSLKQSKWKETDCEAVPDDEFESRSDAVLSSVTLNGEYVNVRRLRNRSGISSTSDDFDAVKNGKSPNPKRSPSNSFIALRESLFSQHRSSYIDNLIDEYTAEAKTVTTDKKNDDSMESMQKKNLSAIVEQSVEEMNTTQTASSSGVKSPNFNKKIQRLNTISSINLGPQLPKNNNDNPPSASLLTKMVSDHLLKNRNIKISPDKNDSNRSPFESLINKSLLQSTQIEHLASTESDMSCENDNGTHSSKNIKPVRKTKKTEKPPSQGLTKRYAGVFKRPFPIKENIRETQGPSKKLKNSKIKSSKVRNKDSVEAVSTDRHSDNRSNLDLSSIPNAITIYSPKNFKRGKLQNDSVILRKKDIKNALGPAADDKIDDNFELKINSRAEFFYIPAEKSLDEADSSDPEEDFMYKLKRKERQSLFVVSEQI